MTGTPWTWPASIITRLIDGDTLTARVTRDLGFHGTATFDVKLRLNRINAPAIHTKAGAAALTALTALLSGAATVDIVTVGPYKYGDEWMAEITLPGGTNVSDAMIAAGHAQPWDGQGPRPGG